MGLLKGNKDEDSVQKASEQLLSGKVAKGVGGQAEIDGDWITIRHKGVLGVMGHGLAGEKRILISNVTAVTIKEPRLTNGYIHFSQLGALDRQRGGVLDATRDENTVMFSKNHLAEFVAIKLHVEERIARAAQPSPTAVPADIPSQLSKLAELRDAGVLTDEEFQAKKAELLARM